MTKLMKFLSLVLCLCAIFTLVSCDLLSKLEDGDTSELGEVTEEEWNAAISEEKFDNVTFAIVAHITSPYEVVDNIVCTYYHRRSPSFLIRFLLANYSSRRSKYPR